ncbi:hypothetical protein ACFYPT_42215 [Streptomyces sp. NPDC005529]|uniref:hypothetical protein n=1 Tax=unclassified Streptomyces TaxID=2593676 RepID=UPI0033BB76A6
MAWTKETLAERQDNDVQDIKRVILRLANRREYLQQLDGYDAVITCLQDTGEETDGGRDGGQRPLLSRSSNAASLRVIIF